MADDVLRQFDHGAVLRAATDADAEQIAALNVEVFGKQEEAAVRTLLEDPTVGPERFTVVVDGERVVSSLCLMTHTWRLGGVDLPVGRPEYVATASDYRRRGYIRAQLDVVHRWSEERGDLVQMITGIAYAYRRFGYEYAIRFPAMMMVRFGTKLDAGAGWATRTATLDDQAAARDLFERDVTAADLYAIRTELDWQQLLTSGPQRGATALVAEHDGRVQGVGVVTAEDDNDARVLHGVSGTSLAAVRAVVGHAHAAAGDRGLYITDRPGTLVASFLASVGSFGRGTYAYYVRVSDPLALLRHLQPVLSDRLEASPLAAETGELVLSLYQRTFTLAYAQGEVTSIEESDLVENPYDDGVVGVPPDRFATLVFGRDGPRAMSERYEDVWLADQGGLMEVLFPRLVADVYPHL